MRRVLAGLLAVGLLVLMAAGVPATAEARYRQWPGQHGHGNYGHGHRGHGYHGHGSPAYFWGGVAAGALTGLVVGGIFAPRVYAAPPVVYQPAPAPVYAPPAYVAPPPVCQGHWVAAYWNGYGWVPGHWEQVCR